MVKRTALKRISNVTTVNCLYNSATNGTLPGERVTQMSFMDAVSLYSTILTLDHPVADFVLMDSTQNPSLFEYYSSRIMDYDTEFFVHEKQLRHHLFFATVHVSYSPQQAKWHSLDFSAFPISLSVQPEQISEMQRLWFDASGKKVPKNTRLTSACFPNILSQHLELLFYECLFLGCSIVKVERLVRSKGFPIFKDYINNLNAQRQKEESSIHSKIVKALSNSLAGKKGYH